MKISVDAWRIELVEELLRELVDELPFFTRRPVATYRVQLNRGFGFQQASELVPYLASLGVSDLYTSPCLKAAPGSLHGYDVVDSNELNPELGTTADYDALSATLAGRGMGHLLDFVPNHMAIGSENPLWMDVLENGPSSVNAHFFDVDWRPIKEELENRVLVPILGDQYGTVLERGELRLHFENGGFWLNYYEHRFPVTPRQYPHILRHRLDELQHALPPEDVHLQDLLSIIAALANLPPRTERDPARIEERHREKEVIKRRIVALCEASPPIRAFIEENVRLFNGTAGDPRSFDLLDALLREQAYRLAYWRVAAEEINYRRFFDINSLAAIRMEDRRVRQRTHALVFRLIGERKIGGLRIDHPDGLFCPPEYFASLQEELAVTICRKLFLRRLGVPEEQVPEGVASDWRALEPALRAGYRGEAARGRDSPLFRPLFVVVEKILGNGEKMPEVWPVHGTTGYDFMALLNGLFVDERNAQAIDDVFARFTGLRIDYAELVYDTRRLAMSDSMSSELNVLARQLSRICEHDRRTRDFTLNSLKRALVEVIACFPVYRTYVGVNGEPLDEHDRRYIESAVRRAKRKNPTVNATIFDFIRDVLLGQVDPSVSEEVRRERRQFVLKLQQVTAPVMAKSVEDTVFYIYNRLVSLNEVGGEPDVFGVAPGVFHAWNQLRARHWPGSLASTSTHDTKRSEDVRARINVLSEIPIEWKKHLASWSRLNRRLKVPVGEQLAPDRNEEILLYQTLLGTWPFEGLEDGGAFEAYRARIQAYMEKAIKEAKVNTSWVNPHEDWERAVAAFVAAVLDPMRSERFWGDLLPFQRKLARAGACNSLSQLLLKVVSPGVPDLYQGMELWDFSLVDPDNRRPVDFAERRELLGSLDARLASGRGALARELAAHYQDGQVKLYVTSQLLRLRRRVPELFLEGEYVPLSAQGERALNVIAIARRLGERSAIALGPRLVSGMLDRAPDLVGERAWADTFVDIDFEPVGMGYVDLFTGTTLRVADDASGRTGMWLREAFTGFPVVLALREDLARAVLPELVEGREPEGEDATDEQDAAV